MDDARLLLLEGSCSFDDKASCLASVGLISLGADGCVCRSDLLLVYLEGADMLLDSALKDLGDGPVRDSAGDGGRCYNHAVLYCVLLVFLLML